MRGLVPAEAARHPPGYLAAALAAGARPPLARLLGLRSAPTAEIIGATGIDAAWMQAQEVERAGVVLVFSGAGFVQDAELVTSDRFRGGVTSGEFVVVELASAMPLCGGVFTSTSSREVIASQGQEDSALEADLSGQAMSGIDRSLLGISSYLRYQSRL